MSVSHVKELILTKDGSQEIEDEDCRIILNTIHRLRALNNAERDGNKSLRAMLVYEALCSGKLAEKLEIDDNDNPLHHGHIILIVKAMMQGINDKVDLGHSLDPTAKWMFSAMCQCTKEELLHMVTAH